MDPETPPVENHRSRKSPTCPELGRQVRGHGRRHDDQGCQRLFKVLTVLQQAGRGPLGADTGWRSDSDMMLLVMLADLEETYGQSVGQSHQPRDGSVEQEVLSEVVGHLKKQENRKMTNKFAVEGLSRDGGAVKVSKWVGLPGEGAQVGRPTKCPGESDHQVKVTTWARPTRCPSGSATR